MRLPARASTPVRLTVAVGHKLERTSRVTCCEAKAVSRATEICGLFLSAIASASLRESCWGTEGVCPQATSVAETTTNHGRTCLRIRLPPLGSAPRLSGEPRDKQQARDKPSRPPRLTNTQKWSGPGKHNPTPPTP